MQFASSSDLLFINTSAEKTKEDFWAQNSIESDIYISRGLIQSLVLEVDKARPRLTTFKSSSDLRYHVYVGFSIMGDRWCGKLLVLVHLQSLISISKRTKADIALLSKCTHQPPPNFSKLLYLVLVHLTFLISYLKLKTFQIS